MLGAAKQFPAPVWKVQWGTEKGGYVTFVNATHRDGRNEVGLFSGGGPVSGGARRLRELFCGDTAPGVFAKAFDPPPQARLQLKCLHCAPVAQLDRAFASGAKGRQFESARAYHPKSSPLLGLRLPSPSASELVFSPLCPFLCPP